MTLEEAQLEIDRLTQELAIARQIKHRGEITTVSLIINKSARVHTLVSLGDLTIDEFANQFNRTVLEFGDLIELNFEAEDLDNLISELKPELVSLGYVKGGNDFANTDETYFWVLGKRYRDEQRLVNSNWKVISQNLI